ncbi:hypothetical protein MNBD_GAMMA03-925 [hydrothermal vent metagenome]|uniref:Uncharacterized protein n=1 Tax=hydrothermal vent metagenome TaxID=652676 RepID=A0A3B0WAV5_9ZZZZ
MFTDGKKYMNKLLMIVLILGVPMFGFGKDHQTIEVKIFEGESKTPFATSNMPITQLPDTFEIDTTMHLGGDEWIILDAKPIEKVAFRKSGKLSLYLTKKKIYQMDPNDLLYSLPTINDSLANVEHADSLENVAVFLEDNWRQFEFLEAKFKSYIGEEFADIDNIYSNHKENIGFNQLHVRKRIPDPFDQAGLIIDDLFTSFEIDKKYDGVAFNSAAGTLVGGFAFETKSGWILWGQKDQKGKIVVLNISQTGQSSLNDMAEKVDAFTQKYSLYIVNWPRLYWGGIDKLGFLKFD